MEIQNRRRFEHNGRSNQSRGTHQQSTDSGNDPVGSFEIRSSFPRSIEDEHLLLDQQRFGDNRTQTAGTEKPSQRRNEVDEQDNHVAYGEILAT